MSDHDDVEHRDEEGQDDGPLFSFDDTSSMPHWSEPATGEMPVIDTSTTLPGPRSGGSRLFPQLPDDPNMTDEGPTTGVLGSIDPADQAPAAPSSDSPTGIELPGTLAGGILEPEPTGPLDDVMGLDPDGDLPAPRWGASTSEASSDQAEEEPVEGFLGSVDPGALADVESADSEFDGPGAQFARRGDEFVGGDLSDLDDLIADTEPSPFNSDDAFAVDDAPRYEAEPADAESEDERLHGDPVESTQAAPTFVADVSTTPRFAPEPGAGDGDEIDAWSALDDPSPLWREGAQDYESHRPSDDAAERMVLHTGEAETAGQGAAAPSGGRNMPIAVLVGVVLAGAFLGLVDRGPGYAMIMVVPLLVLATSEFFLAVRKVGYRPATLLGLTASAGLPLAAYWKGPEAIPLVLTILTIFGLLWYLFGIEPDRPTANLSVTIFGVMWVGLLGAHIPLVLELPHGSGILLGAIIGTVTYDIAGLFIGRATGQSRLAPSISPNKTYEGLIGGMIMSILVVTFGLGLAPGLAPWDLNQVDALLLGIVVAVIAPLGDLAQSLIKRDLGIKDMGTALPGHGGVFDRFDALLLVIPAVYYLALARDLDLLVL